MQDYLILPTIPANTEPSWFGFLISVKPDAPFSKQEMVEYLEHNGIGTRQLFAGNILRQPMLVNDDIPLRIANAPQISSKDLDEAHYSMLPNTDFIMNNTFWVGTFPALDEKDLEKTSAAIHKFVNEKIS